MPELSREACEVLLQAARDGNRAARRLLADLGGPPEDEDLPVPACIRAAQLRRPFFFFFDLD
jgi:hypothetical protein